MAVAVQTRANMANYASVRGSATEQSAKCNPGQLARWLVEANDFICSLYVQPSPREPSSKAPPHGKSHEPEAMDLTGDNNTPPNRNYDDNTVAVGWRIIITRQIHCLWFLRFALWGCLGRRFPW